LAGDFARTLVKTSKLMKENREAVENYCDDQQFSSFRDDGKTVFIMYRAMAVPLQGSFP
jgi:hypothetical protein